MPDPIDPRIKADRWQCVAELAGELHQRFWGRLIGRRLRVLVETPRAERPSWMPRNRLPLRAGSRAGRSHGPPRRFVDVEAHLLADHCIQNVLPSVSVGCKVS
jgi:hypothetical protein